MTEPEIDPAPQTAAGKVLLHFLISLDGFVAGPGHNMDYMNRTTVRDGLVQEYIATTGAILAGRDGFDSAIGDARPTGEYGRGPSSYSLIILRMRVPPRTLRTSTARWRRRCGSAWKLPKARTSRCSHPRSANSFLPAGSSTRSTCTLRRCCSGTAFACTTCRAERSCICSGSVTSPRAASTSAIGRLPPRPASDLVTRHRGADISASMMEFPLVDKGFRG